jgi:hypothetical protein
MARSSGLKPLNPPLGTTLCHSRIIHALPTPSTGKGRHWRDGGRSWEGRRTIMPATGWRDRPECDYCLEGGLDGLVPSARFCRDPCPATLPHRRCLYSSWLPRELHRPRRPRRPPPARTSAAACTGAWPPCAADRVSCTTWIACRPATSSRCRSATSTRRDQSAALARLRTCSARTRNRSNSDRTGPDREESRTVGARGESEPAESACQRDGL